MTDFNQKTHDTDVGSHGGQSRQMMEVFENQEFGSIRVLQEAGKTFFCASDVAKALGYVNPYAAVKRHCRGPLTKREGVVQKVNQYGDAGEQVVEIAFITEGDVYRLIVHSKLPSAERFEHWVFDEVLPSIRKHGVYMSDSILDQVIQHPEVIYTLAQELVAEREQLEGIRKQLDAAQPKADYFDTFVNSEDCTCIRNFCKEIGIPEKTAVALLLDHRYLYRRLFTSNPTSMHLVAKVWRSVWKWASRIPHRSTIALKRFCIVRGSTYLFLSPVNTYPSFTVCCISFSRRVPAIGMSRMEHWLFGSVIRIAVFFSPSGVWRRCIVLRIWIILFSREISSQVNAHSSPTLIPVNRQIYIPNPVRPQSLASSEIEKPFLKQSQSPLR